MILLNAKTKELSVCFESLEAKKKALEADSVAGVGIPTIHMNQNIPAGAFEPFTIFGGKLH
jgi:hypothetical protein